MSIQQGILSGAKWAFAARWYSRVVGICSTLILVRLLDVSDFGIVALATFFVSLFAAISQAGAVRYILVHDNLTDDQIASIWSLNVAIRSLFTVIMMLSSGWIAAYTNEPKLQLVIMVISINLFLTAFRNVGLDLQEKQFLFRQLTLTQIIAKTAGTVVSISLAVLLENYWALISGMVMMQTIEIVSGYILCSYRPYWCTKHWKEQWGFSRWMVAISILGYMRSRVDIVLLGNFVSTRGVGLYSTSLEFSWLPMSEIATPMQRGLMAALSSVKDQLSKMQKLLRSQLVFNAALMVPSAFGTYAVAEPFVNVVLGDNWTEAIPVVKHLTWLMMSSILYMPFIPALTTKKKFFTLAILDSIIILLVVIGFYSYREAGVEVLSFVRAIVAFIFCAVLIVAYRKFFEIGFGFFFHLAVLVFVPSLVMYSAVNWSVNLPYSDIVRLFLSVGIGVAVYVPLYLLLSYAYRTVLPDAWKLSSMALQFIGKRVTKLRWRLQ